MPTPWSAIKQAYKNAFFVSDPRMPSSPVPDLQENAMTKHSHPVLWALAITLLQLHAPVAAQRPAPPPAQSTEADVQMAEDAGPFRRAADAFVASAMAGDAAGVRAMLSPTLVERSGDAAIRRALETQILPFFAAGKGVGRSTTITRTTTATGEQGFAFYMWLVGADASAQRPFTVYVVEEKGRLTIANVVPDRLVEGRHR